jgi:ABC-type nitrate/sulfonate/bicarbonate transport system substrate-binding protein
MHQQTLARLVRLAKRLLQAAALAALAAGIMGNPAQAQTAGSSTPKELRIGYQKYGTLVILKARGTLEKRLAGQGVDVKWTEFPFGPPLLEAINVGSIDVGTSANRHRSSLRQPAPIWFTWATNRRRRPPRRSSCQRIRPSRAWQN